MRTTILVTLLLALLLGPLTSIGAEKRIIILPFDSVSREDLSFLQEVVPKLLTSRVAVITGFETEVSSFESPDEVRARYDPSYVISGTVTKLGATYSLDIAVRDRSGEKIGGFFASAADENGILASLEDLAKDVAGVLPKDKTAGEATPEASVTGGTTPAEASVARRPVEEGQSKDADKERVDQHTSRTTPAGEGKKTASAAMATERTGRTLEEENANSDTSPPLQTVSVTDEAETTPLLEKFKARHEEIRKAAKDGKLSGEKVEKADSLWVSLQKYLIDNRALIEKYKLEAREYRGSKQEEALDNIVTATAEREQTIMSYIEKLDNLSELEQKPATAKQKPETIGGSSDPEKDALDSTKKTKKKWYEDIEIEIKPEDIIKEDQPAE